MADPLDGQRGDNRDIGSYLSTRSDNPSIASSPAPGDELDAPCAATRPTDDAHSRSSRLGGSQLRP